MATRLLIVDDSALMRRHLANLFETGGYQVRCARNGAEAVLAVREFAPDVVTLDINMPEMDGLTALAHIMQERPTPVVMVSSLTEQGALATFEALALGAVDFVAKPGGTISLSMDEVAPLLLSKVKEASRARVRRGLRQAQGPAGQPSAGASGVSGAAAERAPERASERVGGRSAEWTADRASERDAGRAPARCADRAPERGAVRTLDREPERTARQSREAGGTPASARAPASAGAAPVAAAPHPPPRGGPSGAAVSGVVLIGVSTGGPGTLEAILPLLPADYPYPVVVAQHMPAAFTGPFARRLDTLCALRVSEVGAPQELVPGNIYIARGSADTVLATRGGRLTVLARPETQGHLWHPSVELLARSALEHCAPRQLIGVMLTGMGHDGADAFSDLHRQGGRTVAESEETAVVYGMPKALIDRSGATMVLPAQGIARQLIAWAYGDQHGIH